MLHVASTLVVILIATGIYYRRRPSVHMSLMTASFIIDLSLVLYIELTRKAVATVVGGIRPFLWFHAGVSVVTLVLYVVMIALGRKLYVAPKAALAVGGGNSMTFDGTVRTRQLHGSLGIAFCVVRGLNYITSLML
jgi:hypothetical protein